MNTAVGLAASGGVSVPQAGAHVLDGVERLVARPRSVEAEPHGEGEQAAGLVSVVEEGQRLLVLKQRLGGSTVAVTCTAAAGRGLRAIPSAVEDLQREHERKKLAKSIVK